MPRVLFIVNPKAGRGLGARVEHRLTRLAMRHGIEPTTIHSTRPGHERELARNHAEESWDAIVAAGGDGTVHGVANGILNAGSEVPLGVVPLGTGNDFARLARCRRNLERCIRIIAGSNMSSNVRSFDVGEALDEYFVNGFGMGFSASVVQKTLEAKHLKGFALYLTAAFRAFRQFQPVHVSVSTDAGLNLSMPLTMIEIAIGKTGGGGFRLTPAADPEDGLLDLCIIREVGVASFLRHLPRVATGTHQRLEPVIIGRAGEVRLETPEPGTLVHLDGELRNAPEKTIWVTIHPGMLNVLCGW